LCIGGAGVGHHSFEALEAIVSNTSNVELYAPPALAAAALSIVVKEALFRATVKIGVEHRSQVVIANAWHHRSDAISSLVALVGVGGAAVGVPVLDPLAGFWVSGMIIKTGGEIGWGAIQALSDNQGAVEEEVYDTVRDCAQQSGGDILDVHDIRARRMGPYTLVDLHAVVSPRLSVSAAHQAGERIRHQIRKAKPEISEVLVHIDPCVHASWHEDDPSRLMRPVSEIEADVRTAIDKVQEVEKVAHVLCHFLNGVVHVQTEIIVDDSLTLQQAKQIAGRARAVILKVHDISEADVHLELFGDFACSRLIADIHDTRLQESLTDAV